MKFSVSHLFFSYLYIYFFIYLFRAANFMHNINIIHRSFFPTALPHRLPCLSLALPYLSLPCLLPCPACFLALPNSLPCLCLLPSAYAFFLCLFPLPSACFLALPISLPAFFLDLPFSLPCLLPCLTYRSTFFMSARCTGM